MSPCRHPGSGKQSALGQNSFANQSCFREVRGVSAGPLCRDQARMKMSECEWKTQQSTFHVHRRRAKMGFYLKRSPLSQRLKASRWLGRESLFLDSLGTEIRKQSSQLEQPCCLHNRKPEGCFHKYSERTNELCLIFNREPPGEIVTCDCHV